MIKVEKKFFNDSNTYVIKVKDENDFTLFAESGETLEQTEHRLVQRLQVLVVNGNVAKEALWILMKEREVVDAGTEKTE